MPTMQWRYKPFHTIVICSLSPYQYSFYKYIANQSILQQCCFHFHLQYKAWLGQHDVSVVPDSVLFQWRMEQCDQDKTTDLRIYWWVLMSECISEWMIVWVYSTRTQALLWGPRLCAIVPHHRGVALHLCFGLIFVWVEDPGSQHIKDPGFCLQEPRLCCVQGPRLLAQNTLYLYFYLNPRISRANVDNLQKCLRFPV